MSKRSGFLDAFSFNEGFRSGVIAGVVTGFLFAAIILLLTFVAAFLLNGGRMPF